MTRNRPPDKDGWNLKPISALSISTSVCVSGNQWQRLIFCRYFCKFTIQISSARIQWQSVAEISVQILENKNQWRISGSVDNSDPLSIL